MILLDSPDFCWGSMGFFGLLWNIQVWRIWSGFQYMVYGIGIYGVYGRGFSKVEINAFNSSPSLVLFAEGRSRE